jgi:cephalosporin hydroxylase
MNNEEILRLREEYDAEQRDAEVLWFYRYASAIKPKVVVEIGIKEGGNLKILSTLPPKDGLAIGIDAKRELEWDPTEAECHVEVITGNSHDEDTLDRLKEALGGREIDILFIDGDHSTTGMLQDYDDYSPLVRSGGLIAVHDIYYLPAVKSAWDNIPVTGRRYESPIEEDVPIGIGFFYKE